MVALLQKLNQVLLQVIFGDKIPKNRLSRTCVDLKTCCLARHKGFLTIMCNIADLETSTSTNLTS